MRVKIGGLGGGYSNTGTLNGNIVFYHTGILEGIEFNGTVYGNTAGTATTVQFTPSGEIKLYDIVTQENADHIVVIYIKFAVNGTTYEIGSNGFPNMSVCDFSPDGTDVKIVAMYSGAWIDALIFESAS